MSEQKKGIIYAILAYLIWGVFPLFWKLLEHVNSLELIAGRIIWSFVFTFILIISLKQWPLLKQDMSRLWQNQRAFWSLGFASVFIGLNWYVYIWAVNHDHVLQSSLGYYINPLITVVFGMIFFKERLTKWTIAALLMATIGVLILTIDAGQIPFIALLLALSFATYSVLKKKLQINAIRGLFLETLFLLPFAIIYMIYLTWNQSAAFGHVNIKTDLLMILSGVITAIPLILFAMSAQRIAMNLLGFIQYLCPTILLFLGILLYNEPFERIQLMTFSCIFIAVIIFTIGKLRDR